MSLGQTPDAANQFASKVYEAIDSMDEQAFANCLTENCTFVFANSDPVIGRANAAAASQSFLNLLGGIKHRLLNAWAFDDIVVYTIHEDMTVIGFYFGSFENQDAVLIFEVLRRDDLMGQDHLRQVGCVLRQCLDHSLA